MLGTILTSVASHLGVFGKALFGKLKAEDIVSNVMVRDSEKGWKKSFPITKGFLNTAREDTYASLKDVDNSLIGHINYASAHLMDGIHDALTPLAVAADIASVATKATAAAAGTIISAGTGGLLQATSQVAKLAAKTAIAVSPVVTKPAGAIAKTMIKAAPHVAIETAAVGYQTGKALWKLRNNTPVGVAMAGGALAFGIGNGNSESTINTTLNIKSNEVTPGAYYLNPEAGYSRDDYSGTKLSKTRGTIDNIGATGDLVFALNNLRRGGYM